jgi:hypothetical protein
MGAKVRHNRDNRRQPEAFRRPEIFLQIVSIKIHNSPICVSVLRLERRDKEGGAFCKPPMYPAKADDEARDHDLGLESSATP